jgi:hypothetical protein
MAYLSSPQSPPCRVHRSPLRRYEDNIVSLTFISNLFNSYSKVKTTVLFALILSIREKDRIYEAKIFQLVSMNDNILYNELSKWVHTTFLCLPKSGSKSASRMHLDPDPNSRKGLNLGSTYRKGIDPDPYSGKGLDPDPHSGKGLDPDPHLGKGLDPDPHSGKA